MLDHCPRGAALDVGCGTGALGARLAVAGYETVGIDPFEGMLEVLRSRAPGVRALRGAGSSLPFGDDSFDLVLSVAVMHHIVAADEVRRTLAEMVGVSKPSGRVLVWDHNPRNPYRRRLMAKVPQDTREEKLIADSELITGLREAGTEILISRRLGLIPDFIPPSLLRVSATAERAAESIPLVRRLCAHNVILGAKREPRTRKRPA